MRYILTTIIFWGSFLLGWVTGFLMRIYWEEDDETKI